MLEMPESCFSPGIRPKGGIVNRINYPRHAPTGRGLNSKSEMHPPEVPHGSPVDY